MYRRIFLLWASVWTTAGLSAQTPAPVYEVFEVEQPPSYPGGDAAMLRFIAGNFHAPANVHPDSILGSMMVLSFIVDTLGQLTQVEMVKDIGPGFRQEVMQMLQKMPIWLPGRQAGQKVRVRYRLPLRIRWE